MQQDTRHHRLTKSLGVTEAYKWIRKHKWLNIPTPLKEAEFYTIMRLMLQHYAEEILQGGEMKLPYGLGTIELRKKPSILKLQDDGTILNHYPIDWGRTKKLWVEDASLKAKKFLVRCSNKEIFIINYNKRNSNFHNQKYISFLPNRTLKRELCKRIRNNHIGAFKLYDY